MSSSAAPNCSGARTVERFAPDAIMKAKLYAQFNPTKTMSQLINDRDLYRVLIVFGLLCAWFL
jgi:hypothetical protein